MRVDLAFGKSGLSLDMPNGRDFQILEPRWATPLDDPAAEIEKAVAGVSSLARGKQTVAISVCDITRPAPNKLTLPPLLRQLEAAGIHRDRITILIATGLHRPAPKFEIDEIVGPEIAARYNVVNHFAREIDQHRYLGDTRSGTPVYIDERYVSSDLHITLGFIEPHLMAGFSGARKLIAPGLAGEKTIKTLHSPRFMRDPRATEGSIVDNPLNNELWEIAGMAGHDYVLDVVLTKGKRIAAVFAGAPREAHARGVTYVQEKMTEWLPEVVDIAITTCAGYPLDLTFYQAVKGVTAASHIVRPGGIILLFAQCSEGPGAHEFAEMLKTWPDHKAFLDHISAQPVTVDQWQLEKLALVVREKEVWMYVPGVAEEYHSGLWGRLFATPEAALAALPPNQKIAVIPEGPYVLARVRQPELEHVYA